MQEIGELAGSSVEYANQTTVHPVGAIAAVLLSAFLLISPRRLAPVPFVLMACFIPSAQRIVLFGLDFDFIRLLVVAGFLRVVLRTEFRGMKLGLLDWMLIAWTVVSTVAYVIQNGSVSAFIFRLGASYDALGVYFIYRCVIRNLDDVKRVAVICAVIALPVCLVMLMEKATGRNLFSVFGGVPEFTKVRAGRLRCQGAFSHAILAGCFWAGLLPLMGVLWFDRGMRRAISVVGCCSAVAIIYLCASSTPLLALVVVVVGVSLLPLRSYLGYVQVGALLMLVGLHMSMNQPIWHLIARVSAVGGSTGWHRFRLIDEAISRFGEWALVGTRTTAHWGRGMQDITNQYVLEGVRGGILTLLLFLGIIFVAFRAVGQAWRDNPAKCHEFLVAWAVGISLAVHCACFIGVSYFGQITMLWYMTLAISASLGQVTYVDARSSPEMSLRKTLIKQ